FYLFFVYQRTYYRSWICWVPTCQLLDFISELTDKFIVNCFMNDYPIDRHTNLTLVRKSTEYSCTYGKVYIRVIQYNEGIISSYFTNMLTDWRRTRKRNRTWNRVFHKPITDF